MPIYITESGTNLTIQRRLDLPKVGELPAETLEADVLAIDLGIKTSSPAGKEIIKHFKQIYAGLIASGLKTQQKQFTDTRAKLAAMIAKSDDPKKTEAFAKTEQKKLVAVWNAFSKNGLKKRAYDALDKASGKVSKSAKEQLDTKQIKISDVSLKDNRVSFLSGVLAIVKGGAVAALGSSLLISGFGIAAGLIGAALASQQLIEKYWKQTSSSVKDLQKVLADTKSNTKKTSELIDRIRLLQKSQRSEIAKEAVQRSKLQAELTKLKSTAAKEKNLEAVKHVKAVEARLAKSQKAIELQKSALYDPTRIQTLVAKADELLARAEAEVAQMAGTAATADKAAVFTVKDSETLLKSIQAYLKVVSKT